MIVMVTGAAGYIGSVCAELLARNGFSVIAIDDLRMGFRNNVPASVHAFYQVSIEDTAAIDTVFERHAIEAVIHCAGDALVGESVLKASKYYRGNLATGICLLDTMVRHNVKNIVFSSTCAVYGAEARSPIREDVPAKPGTPYGISKLMFEQILGEYGRWHGIRHVTLRYFNVAGAAFSIGERRRVETHLLPLVLDVAEGKSAGIDICGKDHPTADGTCVRDYVHVYDVGTANLQALKRINTITGSIMNIGTGRGTSVKELIAVASRITGITIPSRVVPARGGDSPTAIASIAKAMCELKWQPKYSSIEEIIISAWQWRQSTREGQEPLPERFGYGDLRSVI